MRTEFMSWLALKRSNWELLIDKMLERIFTNDTPNFR